MLWIEIKPTLVGNKRQAIKARIHVNMYLRENNNHSRPCKPSFRATPVQKEESTRKGERVLRDVGNTASKRKRERKEEGESSPSMFNACSLRTCAYTYSHVMLALNFFFFLYARIARIVLSNDPLMGTNTDVPIENDVNTIKSYRQDSNDDH